MTRYFTFLRLFSVFRLLKKYFSVTNFRNVQEGLYGQKHESQYTCINRISHLFPKMFRSLKVHGHLRGSSLIDTQCAALLKRNNSLLYSTKIFGRVIVKITLLYVTLCFIRTSLILVAGKHSGNANKENIILFLARLHEVHRAIVVTSVVRVYVYVRLTLSVKVF